MLATILLILGTPNHASAEITVDLAATQQSKGNAGRRQQQTQTAPPPRPQPSAPAKSASSSRKKGSGRPTGAFPLQCEGNVNYYGALGNYLNTDQFSFRTRVDWDAMEQRIANVAKGPLYENGASYRVIGFVDDVAELEAISTRNNVTVNVIRLDTVTGQLNGEGEIYGRFSKRTNLGRRKAVVEGYCAGL